MFVAMRLVVLGASGGVGQWVVTHAADARHAVSAVVRQEFSRLTGRKNLSVVRGDVTDPDFVDNVIDGHDAVVSCVGIPRAGTSPFAKLLSPPDLTARVASVLTRAMENRNVRRVVVI